MSVNNVTFPPDLAAYFKQRAAGLPDDVDRLLITRERDRGCKLDLLRRSCLAQLWRHEDNGELPTNGRFVFYELEQLGVVPKKYNGLVRTPAQDITDALMFLREVGLIPWDWLSDETRSLDDPWVAGSVAEYMLGMLSVAEIDKWPGRLSPLVLCESRGVQSVLRGLSRRYGFPLAATAGQAGGFLVTEIAPLLDGNGREVLYCGDLETGGPGQQIEEATRRAIEKHVNRDLLIEGAWTRIALTTAQVAADPHLASLVIDKLDGRYKPVKTYQAVECEAYGQGPLVRLVEAEIQARLPRPIEVTEAIEEVERDALRQVLLAYGGT